MIFLANTLPTTVSEKVNESDSLKVAVADAAQAFKSDPDGFLSHVGQQAIDFGLKLLAAVLIYAVGAWLIKKVKQLLRRSFKRHNTEPTLASFVLSLATISLTVLLIIITISTLGVNTTSFAAILAAGGMAIGMALSGTVQNFAGGLMILLFKPFKVGDYIKAQGYEGFVTEVSIVNTRIRTFANSIIILPNGTLFNGNIDNFSDKPLHRCEWKVSVAYGSDAGQVREILLGIAKADGRILDSGTVGAQDPSVHLDKLDDSSVNFTLWAWVKQEDYWPVTFSVGEAIYTELPKRGISFPFPQMDVHMVN